MTKLCLTLLAIIALAVIDSGRAAEKNSSLTEDQASSRQVRSSGARRGKARKSRKGRKGKEVRKGANRNIDKRKNNGKKEAEGKGNTRMASLTIEEISVYRKAFNHMKKAERVKNIIANLDRRVDKSGTFFVEAAEFFKDCPEGSSVYQHLSACGQTAAASCDPSGLKSQPEYGDIDECKVDLKKATSSVERCVNMFNQGSSDDCNFERPTRLDDCNYNTFEAKVKEKRNECDNGEQEGTFAFCVKLLKKSYGIAASCRSGTCPATSTAGPITTMDCRQFERISGEGWVRVRHIPQGDTWHPVNDNLMGTAEYGDPQDDTQPWSIPWSVLEVEEFLFATGDQEKWMIVNKVDLIGADGTKEYTEQKISIRASSQYCEPYQAVMYKRSYIDEDPYVNIGDHPIDVMYAEVSYPHHNQLVMTRGGMDVFIKKSSRVSWNGNCVRDSSYPYRLLPTNAVPGYDLGGPFPSNTPARCIEACDDQGFLFAGVQTGHECWCGNEAPPEDRLVPQEECNLGCSGDSDQICGAVWRMNVYRVG